MYIHIYTMNHWAIHFAHVIAAEKKVKFEIKVTKSRHTTACQVRVPNRRARFCLSLTKGHIVRLSVVAGKSVTGDISNYSWDFRKSNWNPEISDWRLCTLNTTAVEDEVRAALQDF